MNPIRWRNRCEKEQHFYPEYSVSKKTLLRRFLTDFNCLKRALDTERHEPSFREYARSTPAKQIGTMTLASLNRAKSSVYLELRIFSGVCSNSVECSVTLGTGSKGLSSMSLLVEAAVVDSSGGDSRRLSFSNFMNSFG
jgi:hypothetical protein